MKSNVDYKVGIKRPKAIKYLIKTSSNQITIPSCTIINGENIRKNLIHFQP